MESIRPGIVTANGDTIYPTGQEWILAFAIKGCQWAIDEVSGWNMHTAMIITTSFYEDIWQVQQKSFPSSVISFNGDSFSMTIASNEIGKLIALGDTLDRKFKWVIIEYGSIPRIIASNQIEN